MSSVVDDDQIDLIYERSAFFLFAGARIAKKNNIPYIVEVNEISGEDRVRQQFFISRAKRIEEEVFSSAQAIIVVSKFLKSKIEEMGVDGNKIHVIPNAADASIFDPSLCKKPVRKEQNIPSDAIVIGFIGWFVPWHNFDLLIEAFGKLSSKKVYLMLVGDGLLKDEIKRLAEKHQCLDRLIFPGAIKYNGIPEYVYAMDICTIPGSNDYRSPIKLFEYMIMGKVVVAPRLEPIEFIAEDGLDIKMFESGNLDSLVAAFEELVIDEEKREVMGANARHLILEKHLWVHNAQQVVDIFQAFDD
jgi:glycosyltransferase involved in cell wall biosynthesis